MTAVAFDTHDAANRFKAAGFTDAQVEALVDVARVTTALPDISTLATKADLLALKVDLERGQAELRSDFNDLKTEFAGLRTEFTSQGSEFRSLLNAEIAGVRTAIATSQLQTTAMLLAGVGALLALSRLIH